MKIKMLFIFLVSSCYNPSIVLEPFSTNLLQNKKYHNKTLSFTSEFKIIDWYKNQKTTEIK